MELQQNEDIAVNSISDCHLDNSIFTWEIFMIFGTINCLWLDSVFEPSDICDIANVSCFMEPSLPGPALTHSLKLIESRLIVQSLRRSYREIPTLHRNCCIQPLVGLHPVRYLTLNLACIKSWHCEGWLSERLKSIKFLQFFSYIRIYVYQPFIF